LSVTFQERTKYWIEQSNFYAEEEPEEEAVEDGAEGTAETVSG